MSTTTKHLYKGVRIRKFISLYRLKQPFLKEKMGNDIIFVSLIEIKKLKCCQNLSILINLIKLLMCEST